MIKDFLIGLLISILIGVVIIAIIFAVKPKKKKTTKKEVGTAGDSPKNKYTFWSTFLKIIGSITAVFFVFLVVMAFIGIISAFQTCNRKHEVEQVVSGFSGTKYDASLDGKPITYIESGTIGPGKVWETSRVHYRFAFRTQNYVSYQVEFTSKNGGWTRSVLYKKGEINRDPLPDDATQGPVRVSTLPGETSTFEVILYKTD